MRIRLRYSITGRIRFISHLDLMRVFFRVCIRKDVPVVVSQGYSPHLKLSFCPPLSVGMTSACEYLDMYLEKEVSLVKLKTDIQSALPEGIRIEDVCVVPDNAPKLFHEINGGIYLLGIPGEYLEGIENRIKDFLAKEEIIIKRNGTSKNIRPFINTIRLEDSGRLSIHLFFGKEGGVKPIEVIGSLYPCVGISELALWRWHREKLTGV